MFTRLTSTSPWATSWADAWDIENQIDPSYLVYADPNKLTTDSNFGYISYMLGACAMASKAGVAGAQTAYSWLHDQMVSQATASRYAWYKWTMAP